MPIDFTNTNLVWTSILVETLHRLGLATAIVCPGSRSAPLAIAVANHPYVEAIPVLDERSASFFALGLARQSHRPIALICTSGTAGANFYPAVIEAKESGVSLLILTADRPPELRDCNAGQAIDQHKLYGTFPNWQTELAMPTLELPMLAYLRQTLIHAWERALYPVSGVVHLNLPFREPLAPTLEPSAQALASTFDIEAFFASVTPNWDGEGKRQKGEGKSQESEIRSQESKHSSEGTYPTPHSPPPTPYSLLPTPHSPSGIIIAGTDQPEAPEVYCRMIAHLSQVLGYPVLAEGLSPLRNYADWNPNLITTYDLILRNAELADKLAPETVIRIGGMPTSKQLRVWLETTQPRQWIIDPDGRNLDPLHGNTTHLRRSITTFLQSFSQQAAIETPYLTLWRTIEAQVRQTVDQTLREIDGLFEGKAAWLLSQVLPVGTPLFINSSMPVRDVEWFWAPGNSRVLPYFNRGANGIDGTLSTALGIAHRQQSSVMLTGDLALLHDTNGFLLRQHFVGHLTIVLINNNGGGIFEMLPIAQHNPPFEAFFATPQAIDFAKLCTTYGVVYERITTWQQLEQRLNPLPTKGMRVLEIRTDRKADAQWRKQHLGTFAARIKI
ncbi:MAG: 2-succinyl-5-enolpyruvyl-6-hydroxy-3-cyclohexene-1-carboxylic-acid synthase [Stenomitos rutilans HA7619-LM2]|jgi:2-succinyl-5-enolpyruvyl-6-hydroxy-3-cyclohexene-1-carboxylate synthase|nr:2-succinyl-5-enolpyruvyl-6-hydroxy-3-cyclohexene-1-carboxylic-acid synthase [Stenomitos rutilans HA7619-LM2]